MARDVSEEVERIFHVFPHICVILCLNRNGIQFSTKLNIEENAMSLFHSRSLHRKRYGRCIKFDFLCSQFVVVVVVVFRSDVNQPQNNVMNVIIHFVYGTQQKRFGRKTHYNNNNNSKTLTSIGRYHEIGRILFCVVEAVFERNQFHHRNYCINTTYIFHKHSVYRKRPCATLFDPFEQISKSKIKLMKYYTKNHPNAGWIWGKY